MEKVKKVSIKTMRSDLTDIVESDTNALITGIIKDMPKEYPFGARSGMKDGKTITQLQCSKCGCRFEEKEYRASLTQHKIRCPECGNTYDYGGNRDTVWFFDGSDENYSKFIIFNAKPTFRYGDEEIEISLTMHCAGAYTPENGMRFVESRYCKNLLTTQSNKGFRFLRLLEKAKCVQPEYEEMKDRICEEQRSRKPDEKKKVKRAAKGPEKILQLPLTPDEDVFKRLSNHAWYIKDMEGDKVTEVYGYCDRTGNTFTAKAKCLEDEFGGRAYYADYEITCPECGKTLTVPKTLIQHVYLSESNTFVWYDSCHDDEDNHYLVQRVFWVRYNFSDSTKKIKRTIHEDMRKYYGKNKAYVYDNDALDDGAEPHFVFTRSAKKFSAGKAPQSADEIAAVVNETDLARSGFIEAMKQGVDWSGPERINDNYLDAYYRDNRLEQVCKAGFTRMAFDMIRGDSLPENENPGKGLRGILGVTNLEYRMLKELNPGISTYLRFHRIFKTDPQITVEEFQEISGTRFGDIEWIMENVGLSVKEILDYLQRCYDYQCIPQNEALQLWKDYLSMAKDLQYDLRDKTRLCPSSLKLAHDKATFAYKVVEDDMKAEAFRRRAVEMKDLEYENKNDGLKAIAPEKAEDVVQEGTNLKHCVASYVNAVTKGDTSIYFIRQLEEPETSYYTVEVKGNYIKQLRGYCNRAANDKVKKFVQHWANNKGLTIALI